MASDPTFLPLCFAQVVSLAWDLQFFTSPTFLSSLITTQSKALFLNKYMSRFRIFQQRPVVWLSRVMVLYHLILDTRLCLVTYNLTLEKILNFFKPIFVISKMLLTRVFARNTRKFAKYKSHVWQMVQEILAIFIKVIKYIYFSLYSSI